ncbi:PAS domain S-box protein [Candidatus Peregrinibacteria bacterium]|nr:PAS domain S-box protein [Candidatus Peregrinibacteria bacterium]
MEPKIFTAKAAGKKIIRLKKPIILGAPKEVSMSEIKFRRLVENMNEAVWMGDVNERTIYANPKFCKIMEYTLEEMLGRASYDFWTPESAERVRNVNISHRKEGISSSYEGDLLTKSGKKIPVLLSGTPLPDGGTIGIMTDLTELKKKENALRENEQKYRAIFENTGTATIIINENKFIILANSEFEKMAGYKKEQIESKKKWTDFFDKDEVSRMGQYHTLRRKAPESAPRDYETRFVNHKGEVRNVHMTVGMIPGTKNSVASLLDITERKRAEELLRFSEERYRSMIDQSMVGVCMFQGTKISFANQKIANIFGYDNGYELVGKDIGKFLIPESNRVAKKLTLLRQKGRDLPELGEYIGLRKNGKKIQLQTYSKRIIIGGEVHSQVLVVDVTEKKQVERALGQRMKELGVMHRAQSHMLMIRPLCDVLCDISRDIVHALEYRDMAYARIVFDGREYKSCRKSARFLYKIEEPFIIRGVRRGFLQVGYTKKIPFPGKSPFSAEERKVVESVMRLLIKHIHNREILERYQKIVKKSVAGIYIVEKSIIRYTNPSFCKIFGISEKEALGQSIRRFVPGGHCTRRLQKSAKNSSRCEEKGLRKDGTAIDVDIIAQKLDYHGRSGIIGRVHDITKMKAAEAKIRNFNQELQATVREKTHHLEEANRRLRSLNELKDEFIAVTSHELRSPLTSIRGYLSFLMEEDTLKCLPPESRQFLGRAYSNAESLNHLVNNILDVSRLETGRFEIQKSPTDLVRLIKSAIEGIAFQANEKKLKLIFHHPRQKGGLKIPADPIRLSQVIRNLLDNAIKFTLPGHSVIVEIVHAKPYVVFKVIDEGVGIPKDKIGLLFGKFIQIKDGDTRYKGGAGLGLFISKNIVELHGGKITVKSQKQKGTTFTVQLPLS